MNSNKNGLLELLRRVSQAHMQRPKRHEETLSLTLEAEELFCRMDQELIGSRNYAGFAWFWHDRFRPVLGNASSSERVAAHDTLIAAGLALDGDSDAHGVLISLAVTGSRDQHAVTDQAVGDTCP